MSDTNSEKPDKDANDKARKMPAAEFRAFTEKLKSKAKKPHTVYLEGKKDGKHRLPIPDDGAALIKNKTIKIPNEDVKGLCHERARVCIAGASKSAKTFLAMDLAVKLATGQNWIGHEITRKHQVLYLNMEVPQEWFKNRLEKIEEKNDFALPENSLTVFHFRDAYFNLSETFDDLSTQFHPGIFDWIICDPIYAMFGELSEMNPGDMQKFCNELKRLGNNLQAGIIAMHHFPKGNAAGKSSIDRMGGSGILGRWFDAVVSMTKHEEEDCQVLGYDLRNSIKTSPKAVRFKYPVYELDETLDASKLDTGGAKRGGEARPADMSKYDAAIIGRCFPRVWTRTRDLATYVKQALGVTKADAAAMIERLCMETRTQSGKTLFDIRFEDGEVITEHFCAENKGTLKLKAR